jgi:hypothetical protein
MAVLVEAISVVVRMDAIRRSFAGGWNCFRSSVPNSTMCSDGQLIRVGFMAPADAEKYVRSLSQAGLVFLKNGECLDIAVVDQQIGSTMPCNWLEFARVRYGENGGKISVCWLFEGRRMGPGIHMPGAALDLATPLGWTYEGSLSESFGFIPLGADGKPER